MQQHPVTSGSNLDLVWGAEAIAEVIGASVRSTFYLLEKKQLPAEKVGRLWVASRSALRRRFASALGEAA